MKNKLTSIFVLLICLVLLMPGCINKPVESDASKDQHEKAVFYKDLDDIKSDGVLKVISIYSGTSYFLYRGQTMGFEYELLQRYANDLGLDLEVIIVKNQDELINILNRGDGDIIAYGLTITESRKEYVNFTEHHYLTHQVLVQSKPRDWRKMKLHEIEEQLVSNPIELIGDTVSVRNKSSYHSRLINLSEEIGGKIHIDTLPGNILTDEIIRMVADGEIKFTVADNTIAAIYSGYDPILDIKTPMSFSQRVAWAVRKNSPQLHKNLNNWIKEFKKQTDYYVIYDRYFKNSRTNRDRVQSEYFSKNTGKISKFDDLVKKYADEIGWDWRLISALIYQESRFDPNVQSWAGAKGLMQLTSSAALDMGVKNIYAPAENIKGGVKYLHMLWNRWDNITDSIQRMKFVLASYNSGYNHVKDAANLSEKYKDDPLKWDDNVEEYILKLASPDYFNDEVVGFGYLRGSEPYDYVREIFERFGRYKQFVSL